MSTFGVPFEVADEFLTLPRGSLAAAFQGEGVNKEKNVGGVKVTLMGPGIVRMMPPPPVPKTAAELESEIATKLLERIGDNIRVLDTQPCTYSAEGVIKPLTKPELEGLAITQLDSEVQASKAKVAAEVMLARMMTQHAKKYRIKAEDVAPLRFSDEPRLPCWTRIGIPSSAKIDEPPETFAQMLARCETPAMAVSLTRWVGSVLDVESDRSEYLYMHGEGNDGKSTLLHALQIALGNAATVMSTDTLKNDHGSTALEGKRLVCFNEENQAGFAKSATLKRLTGDDSHLINPKNSQLRVAMLQCKVMYVSNFAPSIHGGKADLRRLAYVKLKSFAGEADYSYKGRMVTQANDILAYCWTQYREWRKENPHARIGSAEALEEVSDESITDIAADLFGRHFFITKNAEDVVPAYRVRDIIDQISRDYGVRETLKRMLRDSCGSSKQKWWKTGEGGQNLKTYFGIKLIDPNNVSAMTVEV